MTIDLDAIEREYGSKEVFHDGGCAYQSGNKPVLALVAEVRRLRAEGEWVDCRTAMPDRWEAVLAWGPGLEDEKPVIARWSEYEDKKGNHMYWAQSTEYVTADSGAYGNGATLDHEHLNITHWRTIPRPPTARGEGGSPC